MFAVTLTDFLEFFVEELDAGRIVFGGGETYHTAVPDNLFVELARQIHQAGGFDGRRLHYSAT